jgi:high-affinity iron transporter
MGEKPFYMLSIVIALTVLRDGSEIVMFTYGILASGETILNIMIGTILGLLFFGIKGRDTHQAVYS